MAERSTDLARRTEACHKRESRQILSGFGRRQRRMRAFIRLEARTLGAPGGGTGAPRCSATRGEALARPATKHRAPGFRRVGARRRAAVVRPAATLPQGAHRRSDHRPNGRAQDAAMQDFVAAGWLTASPLRNGFGAGDGTHAGPAQNFVCYASGFWVWSPLLRRKSGRSLAW